MGGGKWSAHDWDTYSTTKVVGKSVDEIYTSRHMDKELDPMGVTMRESRDSDDNPKSNAIIIGLDVTGSMGSVLHEMVKGLNTLVTGIYDRKPVTDPHIMCMGIGDVEAGDRAPLQVTQFEADIRIANQLEKIYLEQGGGGNNFEGYALAHYFAGMHTSIDCFEKRNKKGYLFTIGDEEPTPRLRADDLRRILGTGPERELSSAELLAMASRQYNVFHVIVEEGSHCRHGGKDRVISKWTDLLGQRAIKLSDHTKLSEVIISTIQVCEGTNVDDVVKSWDGSTSLVVSRAVSDLASTASTDGTAPVLF